MSVMVKIWYLVIGFHEFFDLIGHLFKLEWWIKSYNRWKEVTWIFNFLIYKNIYIL